MTVRYAITNVLSSLNLVEGYEVKGTLYDETNKEVMTLSMRGNNKFFMMSTIKEKLAEAKLH